VTTVDAGGPEAGVAGGVRSVVAGVPVGATAEVVEVAGVVVGGTTGTAGAAGAGDEAPELGASRLAKRSRMNPTTLAVTPTISELQTIVAKKTTNIQGSLNCSPIEKRTGTTPSAPGTTSEITGAKVFRATSSGKKVKEIATAQMKAPIASVSPLTH
jgi:hypothetical protein